MTRVLITGGVGFIGQRIGTALDGQGWSVTALDLLLPQVHARPREAVAAFPGDVVVGDITDPAALSRAFDPAPDLVVHLAAETGVGQSMYEADRYHAVNVAGTAAVAERAAAIGAPLVLFSSRAVYGEGARQCAEHGRSTGPRCCSAATPDHSTEHDELHPVSVYGETKAAAELATTASLPGGHPVLVLRPQNVIGAGQSLHNPYTGVLAAFLARAKAGLPLQVYGDGSQTRDFVHVDDVVAIVTWWTDNLVTLEPQLTLNAGTGRRTSLLGLAEAVVAAAPTDDLLIEHVAVSRSGDIDHACATMAKAAALGAPVPAIDLQAAVEDFVRWGWEREGPAADSWDDALGELRSRGLVR